MAHHCSIHATGPLSVIDVETTGLDFDNDRIVSFGFVLERAPGDIVAQHEILMKSPVLISPEAEAIHGISQARVDAEGVDGRILMEAVATLLAPIRGAEIPLVVFNAPFDLGMIAREGSRQGLGVTAPEDFGLIIDPLVLDKRLDRFRPGSRKLDALARYNRVKQVGAHTALGDCITELGVARAILGRIPAEVDDETLYNNQREWYAAQQRSLFDHRASTGRPIELREHWPMNPEHGRAL